MNDMSTAELISYTCRLRVPVMLISRNPAVLEWHDVTHHTAQPAAGWAGVDHGRVGHPACSAALGLASILVDIGVAACSTLQHTRSRGAAHMNMC
jgi:hypothetical protein